MFQGYVGKLLDSCEVRFVNVAGSFSKLYHFGCLTTEIEMDLEN